MGIFLFSAAVLHGSNIVFQPMAEKNMHFQIPYHSTLKRDLRGHFRELKRGDQSILGGRTQIESRKTLHLKRENVFLLFLFFISVVLPVPFN